VLESVVVDTELELVLVELESALESSLELEALDSEESSAELDALDSLEFAEDSPLDDKSVLSVAVCELPCDESPDDWVGVPEEKEVSEVKVSVVWGSLEFEPVDVELAPVCESSSASDSLSLSLSSDGVDSCSSSSDVAVSPLSSDIEATSLSPHPVSLNTSAATMVL
jgi:hypothetical protein